MSLEQRPAFRSYDTLSTSLVYGRIDGPNQGYGGVELVSASTTVNATTAGIGTFSPVAVGDFIWFMNGETVIKRKVATKPSNDQITIDSTPGVTKSVAGWYFSPFKSGGTATDGWIPVHKFQGKVSVLVNIVSLGDAGGVTLQIEGKGDSVDSAAVILANRAYAQAEAPVSEEFAVPTNCAAIRVGLKGTSGFAGTDDITVLVEGNPQQ
jgi:hypothetical protein